MRVSSLVLIGSLLLASMLIGCATGTTTAEHATGAVTTIGGSKEAGRLTMRYADAESNYYYVLARMKDVPLWTSLPEHPETHNIDATPEELEALINFREPQKP